MPVWIFATMVLGAILAGGATVWAGAALGLPAAAAVVLPALVLARLLWWRA